MLDTLTALVALQDLDTAAATAQRRAAEIPGLEKALDKTIAAGRANVDAVVARIKDNETARRALEKDTAMVDARMAKFEEHKAAVKTNQEFHALIHEIEVAQATKSGLDDQVLALMAAADALAEERAAAEAALADITATAEASRRELRAELAALEAERARLAAARQAAVTGIPQAMLAKYDQIARNRKGVAVSAMVGGVCTGCHVRLRPNIEQQVRKGDALTQCDSCQRMLYYVKGDAP